MREAYVELLKLVCAHKGVERLERQYHRVRQVLQTPENIHQARKWHSKAVVYFMQQVHDRRVYSVLHARTGHLLSDRRAIARELVGYWSGIMVGGGQVAGRVLCVAAASGLASTVAHAGTFTVEALHSGTRASNVTADGPFPFCRGGWGPGGSVSTVQWLLCTTHA